MASILDRYGIKEVSDVTFYALDANGKPTVPVLYLDTLKVSTIEQTAEEAEARGGKGNPPLIVWDYGKEINVTLEDALFSAKSLAIMFGDGAVRSTGTAASDKYIMRTEVFTATSGVESIDSTTLTKAGWEPTYNVNGKVYDKINPKVYTDSASSATAESLVAGKKYFVTYDLAADQIGVIEISPSSFPGTYYVTGDTYARNEANGEDEFFQWVVPKAKVQSENTITMEAEGDPSVFNMSLRVLRPTNGAMMKLIKYTLTGNDATTAATVDLIHNHDLIGTNAQ